MKFLFKDVADGSSLVIDTDLEGDASLGVVVSKVRNMHRVVTTNGNVTGLSEVNMRDMIHIVERNADQLMRLYAKHLGF